MVIQKSIYATTDGSHQHESFWQIIGDYLIIFYTEYSIYSYWNETLYDTQYGSIVSLAPQCDIKYSMACYRPKIPHKTGGAF